MNATALASCCWCDLATPPSAWTTAAGPGLALHRLVFSDEFNDPSRSFANGEDPKWTALHVADTANEGKTVYLPEQATVALDPEEPGVSALRIATVYERTTGPDPSGTRQITMPFRSAMLQSWNKFCFTGGVVEFRARMPHGSGYWPALWLFGNLGRAVYQSSNTGLWPWSYDECDADLALAPDSPPQRISACDDHDLDVDGLHPFQGRGATEIDAAEVAVRSPSATSYAVFSLQISPAVPAYFKPAIGSLPAQRGPGSWYSGLKYGDGIAGKGWYGPPWGASCPTGCPDTISASVVDDVFDERYRTYRVELLGGGGGEGGSLRWLLDGRLVWSLDESALGAYAVDTSAQRPGEAGGEAGREAASRRERTPARAFPREPMALIVNSAIGTWNGGYGAIDAPADGGPIGTAFHVDWVRVWQSEVNVGCDPPDYPTAKYIRSNEWRYGPDASPLGSETCPEIYPESAHRHAEQIVARAGERRLAAAAVAAARRARNLPAFNWSRWEEVMEQGEARAAMQLKAALWTPAGCVGEGGQVAAPARGSAPPAKGCCAGLLACDETPGWREVCGAESAGFGVSCFAAVHVCRPGCPPSHATSPDLGCAPSSLWSELLLLAPPADSRTLALLAAVACAAVAARRLRSQPEAAVRLV